MQLTAEVECTVTLELEDISESDAERIVQSARRNGNRVDVNYLPGDRYRIFVDFEGDVSSAQALLAEARRVADTYGDFD